MLFQVNKKQEEPIDTLHSFLSLTLRLNLNNKSIFDPLHLVVRPPTPLLQ